MLSEAGTTSVSTELPAIVTEFIDAVSAQDTDRIVATFAPDAYVNDNRREIWGTEAIRAFIAKEFAGDHISMDVTDVIGHYGDVIVRARFDGTYDKSSLPGELILTSYFGIREDKLTSLTIIFNQPSPYKNRAAPGGRRASEPGRGRLCDPHPPRQWPPVT